VRNGTEGPDLSVVGGLWAQYQNALAQNAAAVAAATGKMDSSLSPVPRQDAHSPMEAQDETNSSGQKEEDEVSEDDSDDKLDEKLATTHDPERLKAFNVSKLREREMSFLELRSECKASVANEATRNGSHSQMMRY